MSNLEPHKETITYLILKYGNLDKALRAWMENRTEGVFSKEEDEAILAIEQAKYPNLKLIRYKD